MTDETDDTLLRAVAKSPAVPIAQPFSGNDRFEIVRCIGRGGMGVVHEAIDKKRNSRVALKTIDHLDGDRIYRLKKEFRTLAGFSHENLVSLHELFSDAEHWFFTMELIDGVDLLSYVASNKAKIREVFRQLALGLVAIHQGEKLHRDLKPSNVLVADCGRVVILDFGLSTESAGRPEERSTIDGTIRGTVSYMSPEQAASAALSPASDWYSFGVMLYQALTDRLPHTGSMVEVLLAKQSEDPKAPQKIAEEVPDDLGDLCMTLLRRNPEERPAAGEVLRRLGEAPATLELSSTPDVFVGRDRELGVLRESFELTRSGRPVTVCIEGASGLGKSTLIDRFVDELRESDDRVVVLRGRCHEQESVSFRAFDGVVDSLSVYLRKLPKAQANVVMPREAGALARLFPVLDRVDAIRDAPQIRRTDLDPQEARRRGVAAFRELFVRMTDRSPLILVLDDVQWGDLDSALLLVDALQKPEAPPVLVLVAYRTESGHSPFVAALHRESAKFLETEPKRLELMPLSGEASRDLASKLQQSERATALEAQIARESDGNPFFISEMVRYLAEVDLGTDPAPKIDLSLREMIIQRVKRLPEPAARLLQAIALASRPVDEQVVAKAVAMDPDPSVFHLLRSSHLIRSSVRSEELVTYHDRVRETVVAELSESERQTIHLGLAEALEPLEHADPEALAIHFEGAGHRSTAATHYVRAAEQASRALAFDRAAALYRRALGLGRGTEVEDDDARRRTRAHLADALANAGRSKEAALEYLKAAEDAPLKPALNWKRQAADQYLRCGYLDEGLAVLEEVLPSYGLRLPRALGPAFWWERARLLFRGTRFREKPAQQVSQRTLDQVDVCLSLWLGLSMVDAYLAMYFGAKAFRLALEAGDAHCYARALVSNITLNVRAEKPRDRQLAALKGIAERLDDPYIHGFSAAAAAFVDHFGHARFRRAFDHWRRAEEIMRDLPGRGRELAIAQEMGLECAWHLGDFVTICRRVPELVRDAERRGDLYLLKAMQTQSPCMFWFITDEPEELRRRITETRRRWSERAVEVQQNEYALAMVDLYEGRLESARSRLEGWPIVAHDPPVRITIAALRSSALLGLAQEATGAERERQLRSAEKEARAAERTNWGHGPAVGQATRAGIAWVRGEQDRALAHLENAEAGHEALDLRGLVAMTRWARGHVLSGEEGAQLIREAEAWMTEQGFKRPDRFIRMYCPLFPT